MLPKTLHPYDSYAAWLKDSDDYAGQVGFVKLLPKNPPKLVLPEGEFSGVLSTLSIDPFTYQQEALETLSSGKNVVLTTGTASGKSLVFQAPVIKAALEGQTSILLYPTKALAHDQKNRLGKMAQIFEIAGSIHSYDGDTKPKDRLEAKANGKIILTNPDMLHYGILPYHSQWGSFLSKLQYIVLDELHAYRGVFGTHVALILRRLIRLARLYGANPQIVATSATIANPKEHAYSVTGLEFEEVRATPARTEREFIVWTPKYLDKDKTNRRSANIEAAHLAKYCAETGLKTLVFVNSRRQAELIARYAGDDRVKAYRAGFTVVERRKLEEGLANGDVHVLVSTNALELGVDIGGLDAVILLGYPGSLSSFWQRAGRAGRDRNRALVVWIPREDPLDFFYEQDPALLLNTPSESAVADPDNHILYPPHIHCAAREQPIEESEPILKVALATGLVKKGTKYYTPKRSPHRELTLRGMGGSYALKTSEGKLLGTVDERQAFWETHPGAVYLHQGESYLVRNIDPQSKEIILLPSLEDYYTQVRAETDLDVTEGQEILPGIWVGSVMMRERVTGYVKKRFFSEAVLEEVELQMPEISFPTEAVWFHPLPLQPSGDTPIVPEPLMPSAIHALEHTMIGLLPLFVLAERQDVGGVSYPFYPRPLPSGSGATIFIYDGHPGGVGYARAAAKHFPRWISATKHLLETCPCKGGCPKCILSPKCGNGNQYLDKSTALALAKVLSAKFQIAASN